MPQRRERERDDRDGHDRRGQGDRADPPKEADQAGWFLADGPQHGWPAIEIATG
jgi:hypothetical protein